MIRKPPFDLNAIAHSLRNGAHRDLNSLVRRVEYPAVPEPEKGERVYDLHATPQEYEYVRKCMQRMRDTLLDHVGPKAAAEFEELRAAMDLVIVHRNVMPLDLFALLTSSDDDFTHDVFGIGMFFDRKAGVLTQGFKPRCAKVLT